jgi:glucose-1-phosphate thymidylyltransferase
VIEESYVGPYTSVGEGCKLVRVEVENSVLMDRVELSNLNVRVFNSLLGSDTAVVGGEGRPKGLRLILGEKSRVDLRV